MLKFLNLSPVAKAHLAILATTLGGAFVMAAIDFIQGAHGLDWKHLLVGAATAGANAAWHRYQDKPGDADPRDVKTPEVQQ